MRVARALGAMLIVALLVGSAVIAGAQVTCSASAQGRVVERAAFLADEPAVTGGVHVLAVALDPDGRAAIVTATGDPAAPTERVFDGAALAGASAP